MYGLPESADLSFLRGLELTQVCVGLNETVLRFEEFARIVVETDISLQLVTEVIDGREDVVVELVKLLGTSIGHVEWSLDGTVRLAFTGREAIVQIRDDSPDYESYRIYVDGEPRVVV